MGRRKKEPADVHRRAIARAAEQLFEQKGIKAAGVDEIARAAGYSKATLYVYFKNKEDIVGALVLESMKKLDSCIALALAEKEGTRARYDAICGSLFQYQEELPFYFRIALQEVNVAFENPDALPVEKEIFETGEQINEKLSLFLKDGMKRGDIRRELPVLPTVFSFWGMLSGLVMMASNKEKYIEKAMKMSKREFFNCGTDTLFESIAPVHDMGDGHGRESE